MIELKFKKLHKDAVLPKFATSGAACFDLHAITEYQAPVCMTEKRSKIFDTGLAFEVPEGYVLMIYSRSGHGFKNDVRLANSVGVIDSDYRGEVKVKLTRDSSHPFYVNHLDRIAQAMLVEIPNFRIVEETELTNTERGSGGFGSTGN